MGLRVYRRKRCLHSDAWLLMRFLLRCASARVQLSCVGASRAGGELEQRGTEGDRIGGRPRYCTLLRLFRAAHCQATACYPPHRSTAHHTPHTTHHTPQYHSPSGGSRGFVGWARLQSCSHPPLLPFLANLGIVSLHVPRHNTNSTTVRQLLWTAHARVASRLPRRLP